MLSTIVHTNNAITILNEKTICKHAENRQTEIALESRGILLCGKYVATENKEILEVQENSVKVIGRVCKTPTKIVIDKESMYIADRLGSVYELKQINNLSDEVSSNVPLYLFGSISMITDIAVVEKSIITIDKDNKIRITDREYPYKIQKFILIHSKPLISMVITNGYLVTGGYDRYIAFYNLKTEKISIFDLETKEMKMAADGLPGVDNPEKISNINLDADSKVKKLLAHEKTILIIGNTAPILLDISKIEENLLVQHREIPDLSDSLIVDGVHTDEGYKVIDKTGNLFKITLSAIKPVKLFRVPEYTHRTDISIANKYLD